MTSQQEAAETLLDEVLAAFPELMPALAVDGAHQLVGQVIRRTLVIVAEQYVGYGVPRNMAADMLRGAVRRLSAEAVREARERELAMHHAVTAALVAPVRPMRLWGACGKPRTP